MITKSNAERQRLYMQNLRSRAEATEQRAEELAEHKIRLLGSELAKERAKAGAHEIAKQAAQKAYEETYAKTYKKAHEEAYDRAYKEVLGPLARRRLV